MSTAAEKQAAVYWGAVALCLLVGPLAWNYVAPLFQLPQLTTWQFLCASVALKSLRGPRPPEAA